RHFAEEDLDFGQDALGDRLMGDCEGGGVRRMTMHASHYVGPLLVNSQVQQHLTGAFFRAGELLAFHVYFADIFRLQKSLGHHRRRAEKFALVETDGNVAVIGGREALGIHAPTNLTHLLFQLVFIHEYSSVGWAESSRPTKGHGGPRRLGPPYVLTTTVSRMQAQYASTGFFSGWNGAAASHPWLKPIRAPTPAPRLS